ncbi:MAG: ribonuclease HI family protein [Candidatus Eiseniibacteriota bacterium]|nr:MAG: ribonuclease HI family protein [Candidatus Eisenbacteria bacterium]
MKVTDRLWEEGPRDIRVFIDGCARGNPGHAGCGVLVKDSANRVLLKKGRYVGVTTNNVAEYMALIDGLREAVDFGTQEVTVLTDSELVVKQMNGEYRVKDVKLKELFAEAQRLSRSFAKSRFLHIARSGNKDADSLANDAVDSYLKVNAAKEGKGPGSRGAAAARHRGC